MARGNFELSLNWEKSKISSCKVISKNGGKCTIKYKYIEGVQIKDHVGEIITYTIKRDNIIEFDTNKSGEYFITF